MKSILNNIATCREYLLISSTDFSQCRSSWPVDMFAPYCYKQYIVVKMIMYRNKCKKSHCCCLITINIFSPPKNSIYCLFSLKHYSSHVIHSLIWYLAVSSPDTNTTLTLANQKLSKCHGKLAYRHPLSHPFLLDNKFKGRIGWILDLYAVATIPFLNVKQTNSHQYQISSISS